MAPLTGVQLSSFIYESKLAPRISNVRHHTCVSPSNGVTGTFWGVKHTSVNVSCPASNTFPTDFFDLRESFFWKSMKDVADNNDFEIIPFIADIDGTIAMFSKKFLRDISYGAFTWGVLPFLSDLRALAQSLMDLYTGLKNYPRCTRVRRRVSYSKAFAYEDTFALGVDYPIQQIEAQISVNGVITFYPPDLSKPLNRLRLLLDEIGFHPDLKTAWDVIPLSFVLDYFIPIGDLLESLHPRGWGSYHYDFSGYLTAKGRYTTAWTSQIFGQPRSLYVPSTWEFYEREFRSTALSNNEGVSFETPSLKELFNTTYLTGLFRPAEKEGLKRTRKAIRRLTR
jgi:hypothetical protein